MTNASGSRAVVDLRLPRWARTVLPPVLSAAILAGCGLFDPDPVEEPSYYVTDAGDLTCPAAAYSGATWPTLLHVSAQKAGYDVAFSHWTSGTVSPPDLGAAVVGAPSYRTASGASGGVYVIPIDDAVGLDASSSYYQLIDAPPHVRGFGTAVASHDIQFSGTAAGGFRKANSWEILVGAPGGEEGTAYAEGSLHLYRSDLDEYAATGRLWQPLVIVFPPPGLAGTGAEFGASVALGGSTGRAYYVAVGAPGVDRVFIYEVDTDAIPPLTLVQTLSSPPIARGKRFGASVHLANLTFANGSGAGLQDRTLDLAVGAPGDNTAAGHDAYGRVFVYKFDFEGGAPPYPDPPLTLFGTARDRGTGSPDDFGRALGSGTIYGDRAEREALLVGAPGYDGVGICTSNDTGQICQSLLMFDPRVASNLSILDHVCFDNPTMAESAYFGHAVTAGNFSAADRKQEVDTATALNAEVAVGVPGMNGGEGLVWILATDGEGIFDEGFFGGGYDWWLHLHYPVILDTVASYLGAQGDARFGSSLAADHAGQARIWEDLLVGEPGRGPYGATGQGAVTLTKAEGLLTGCDMNGTWETQDGAGDPVQFGIFVNQDEDKMTLAAQSGFYAEMQGPDGRVCNIDMPGLGHVDFSGYIPKESLFYEVGWDAATGCSAGSDHAERFLFSIAVEGFEIRMEGELAWDASDAVLRLEFDPSTLEVYAGGSDISGLVIPLMKSAGCDPDGVRFVPAPPFEMVNVGGLPCE